MSSQNFSIESVLFGIENIKGPIELVQFSNRLASHEGIMSFNRMAIVKFSNPQINKALPNGVPTDETLIIANEIGPYLDIYLCIRSGKSCCRIATAHFPDGEFYIHDEYRHTILLNKLSDKQSKIYSMSFMKILPLFSQRQFLQNSRHLKKGELYYFKILPFFNKRRGPCTFVQRPGSQVFIFSTNLEKLIDEFSSLTLPSMYFYCL